MVGREQWAKGSKVCDGRKLDFGRGARTTAHRCQVMVVST